MRGFWGPLRGWQLVGSDDARSDRPSIYPCLVPSMELQGLTSIPRPATLLDTRVLHGPCFLERCLVHLSVPACHLPCVET